MFYDISHYRWGTASLKKHMKLLTITRTIITNCENRQLVLRTDTEELLRINTKRVKLEIA